jgi:antitoxin CcdA
MEHAVAEKSTRKKATNLSVRADLLEIARSDGLNLSSMLEQTLLDYCKKKRESQWLEENKEGIAAYNERIDRDGIFGAKFRRF